MTAGVLVATPGHAAVAGAAPPAPEIAEVAATPARPNPNQAIVVSARLPQGSTATLKYKVMFGGDVAVPFLDNAASPGGAGDGVYAASIPGQSAGKLVRYRIDANAAGVAISEPPAADSVRYRGVVVRNPAVSSQLPTIEWFMDDAVYQDILANHRLDKFEGDAVWSLNGEVIDGVKMSVRGNSSRTNRKVNWKVALPKGYEFDLGGQLPYPLDEFALQAYAPNFADVAWATVRAAGNRGLEIVPVRTQRNGQFWSLGRIMETMDGSWRNDKGVDTWAVYKGDGGGVGKTSSPADLQAREWLDKKGRKKEDYTDVWTLSNTIDAPATPAQLAWIYRNVNVSELINYMATNAIIRHHDSGWYNWWLARDTEGTGRWEMWHWDLDWTFTTPARDGKGEFLTPDSNNKFIKTMLAYPEFRQMYFRRLRTLADQFLAPGAYEAQWDAITAKTLPDWRLDRSAWGGYTPEDARSKFIEGVNDRRAVIANNTGPGKQVPTSQSSSASVVINEIHYAPNGTGGEFIELANPGSTAVDISGWAIDAVGLTVQPGTVIPAGGYAVFVANDVAFQQAYPTGNRFVAGQFSGSLDDGGEAVVLRSGARTVDAVTYSSAAPWPTAAAGGGPSLELTSPGVDNAVPSNWRAASTTQGTPGAANTPAGGGGGGGGGPTTVLNWGSPWRYNDSRADLGTAWRQVGYNDGAWASGPGQLGFGEGDEATQLSPGPSNNRLLTAYFRSTFNVANPAAVQSMAIDLLRDDGGVVYINGVEVARTNMPAGTITAKSYAPLGLWGAEEQTPINVAVPPSVLQPGVNTIAVEIHQNSRSSSDLSFDARVIVRQ